jgi:hypothetical protein
MIRVTLSNGEHDERVLESLNHGAVLQSRWINGEWGLALVDMATGTPLAWAFVVGEAISDWRTDDGDFQEIFVQQVPLSEQREMAWAELNALVMERPHCEARRGFCDHPHCRRIEQARVLVDELT